MTTTLESDLVSQTRQKSHRAMLCLAFLVPSLLLTAWLWASLAVYPYDWDPGEGDNVYYAWQIGHGQSPYGDFNQFPMTGSCYPPVYHALCAPFVAALGRQVVIGRVVSWCAMIATSFCIWVLARRYGASRGAAWVAAILYLLCPSVQRWGSLARVDSVMTALGFASFTLLSSERPGRTHVILGALAGVAAAFTKPYAALYLAAGIILMAIRNLRLSAIAVAVAGAAGSLSLIFLQTWSHGWFWSNTVSANATDFSMRLLLSREFAFILQNSVLIMLALAALHWKHGLVRSALAALLVAGIVISLFLGKIGATDNYLLPMAAAAALAAGIALDAGGPLKKSWIPVCAVVFQCLIWWRIGAIHAPSRADRVTMDHVAADLAGIHGDVLVQRNVSLQTIAGKDMLWEPSLLGFLYKAGKWNPTKLIDDMNSGRFAAVIFNEIPVLPVANAIKNNFVSTKAYEFPELDGSKRYEFYVWTKGQAGAH